METFLLSTQNIRYGGTVGRIGAVWCFSSGNVF